MGGRFAMLDDALAISLSDSLRVFVLLPQKSTRAVLTIVEITSSCLRWSHSMRVANPMAEEK